MHAPLCTGLLLAAPNQSNGIGPGEVAPCRIPCLPDAFHTKCNGCHKVPRPPYRMPPLPHRIPRPTPKEYHASNTEYNAGHTGHRARHTTYNACNAKRHARHPGSYIPATQNTTTGTWNTTPAIQNTTSATLDTTPAIQKDTQVNKIPPLPC